MNRVVLCDLSKLRLLSHSPKLRILGSTGFNGLLRRAFFQTWIPVLLNAVVYVLADFYRWYWNVKL
jgi:hypothetical protein